MKEILFVHSDYGELQPGVLVNIDNVEANNLGISKVDVSNNLALRFNSGIPITSIWEDDYSVDVVLKAENDKQPNFTDIPNEYISTIVGNTVLYDK